MRWWNLRIIASSAVVGAAALAASLPAAAEYPEKTIKIVIPYQAGGSTDVNARMLAVKLSAAFKQPVVVENKTGANGMIGVEAVAKSAPDGYTVLIDSPGIVMNPTLSRRVPYDPLKDLVPVARLIGFPFVVIVHPSVPAKTLPELIAYLKRNGPQVNVATPGASTQLAGQLFRLLADVELEFIPYKGSAPAINAMLAGDTQLMFADVPSVAQYVASGRLRALAVTSEKRAALLPDVPTTQEAGMKEFVFVSWNGAYVSAGTAPDIIAKLHAALSRAQVEPDVVSVLAKMGSYPNTTSVEDFTRFYRDEYARWKDVVRRAKVPIEE